jgi:hypothetical protein
MRTIDNMVIEWDREGATDVWTVTLREPIDGLFSGDQVQWEGVIWTVWKIDSNVLTLTR